MMILDLWNKKRILTKGTLKQCRLSALFAASLAFLLLVGNSYGNEFSGLVTRVSARRTINVWKEHLITPFAGVYNF